MDSYILKAVFDEDKAGALFSAFKDLQRVHCDRFAIDFQADKRIKISTQSEAKTVTVMVDFVPEFLKDADLKADFKFGIINVNELVSILNIFSSGFTWLVDSEKMELKTEETELLFYGGNLKIVRNGPKGLDAQLPYLQKIEFSPEKYKSFIKALPVLEHGYAIFKGSSGQNELNISITDKDIKSSSFTQKVKCDTLKDTFKVVVDKQLLMTIFASNSFASMNLGICKDIIHIEGSNAVYKTSFFLKTVV
jgi:hypothetical protein